jgi:hypothetical protein
MKSSNRWLGRHMAALLIVTLVVPASHMGSSMAQQTALKRPEAQSDTTIAVSASGGHRSGEIALSESALPDNPEPAIPQTPDENGQAASPPPDGSQSQDNIRKPVGTAAAPYEPTVGIAASRPAGAAIAPGKQRRVRTIVISLAVIAGAAIAVGSVAALSHGSPSHP